MGRVNDLKSVTEVWPGEDDNKWVPPTSLEQSKKTLADWKSSGAKKAVIDDLEAKIKNYEKRQKDKKEALDVEEKAKTMASSSQKSQYQNINKEMDKLDADKEKLLDQLSKEEDDDKRGKVQDQLHATREKLAKLRDEKIALMSKYSGLRSKD